MPVRSRSISPVTGAVIGGAVIVVLIVAALHPPGQRSAQAPSGSGGAATQVCPDPIVDEDTGRASSTDPANCWLTPVDPATPTDEPTAATDTPADEPTRDEVAHTVPPARTAPSTDARAPDDEGTTTPDDTADEPDDTPTVDCPDVKDHLGSVPAAAASEVNANLAELRQQISDADARLAALAADPVDDPDFVRNTVLGPLKDRRVATLDRITIAIGRVSTPPSDLAARAPCTVNG